MYVGAYAEQDASINSKIMARDEKRNIEQKMYNLFLIWRQNCFLVLLICDFLGCRVDVEAAHQLKKELVEKEECLYKSKKRNRNRYSNMGCKIDSQVFDKLNLTYDRTEKTSAPSFTKNFLQNHPHPW